MRDGGNINNAPPQLGEYMIHVLGEGHDAVFETLKAAQAAAKRERGPAHSRVPVYILQVVDVA